AWAALMYRWAAELFSPCFDCHCNGDACTEAPKSPRRPRRGDEVELAVSALAGLRGAAGYHTSVLLSGEEFYFTPFGICCSSKLSSHESSGVKRVFVGSSRLTGKELLGGLSDHFRPGTYDLLRKNCNTFSDCALCAGLSSNPPPRYSRCCW
ncbi:unnamed protein product, partial [Polarella glacialis]